MVPAPYSEDPSIDAKVWEFRHLAHLFGQADRFDLIHNQADFPAHAFSGLVDTPIVTTIHGFSSDRILPMYAPFQHRVHYVAISDSRPPSRAALRRDDPPRHPARRLSASMQQGSDDLLFFGRIHPDKGAKEAIAAARAVGPRARSLRHRPGRRAITSAKSRRRTDGVTIRYHGAVGGEARIRALGSARALLHLINFDEPFGLSVIEAMASGTPVIATRRGSMPEIIDHGVTGFLVDTPGRSARGDRPHRTKSTVPPSARLLPTGSPSIAWRMRISRCIGAYLAGRSLLMETVATGSPLRNPVFRAIWIASLCSNFGGLIQSVGASWMMTGCPLRRR